MKTKQRTATGFARRTLPAAVALVFSHATWAGINDTGNPVNLPTGGNPADPTKITTTAVGTNSLSVGIAGRAVIDWATFNISSGNTVNFTGSGAVLNRVAGGNATNGSTIAGTLNGSNLAVMLMNPNGIAFTSTAVVNVGALVATTGTINESTFTSTGDAVITGATGSIVNRGQITASGKQITMSNAGLVALVAPSVENSGVIAAVAGKIFIGGAEAATVSMNGGLYEFAVTQGAAPVPHMDNIHNTGTLTTAASETGSVPSGTIILSAPEVEGVVSGTINLSGIQRANRIEVNGKTVVLASDLDATTVAGNSQVVNVYGGDTGAQLQDAVDIAKVGTPGAGATVNVNGTFELAQQVNLNKANLTLQGGTDAEIVVTNPLGDNDQLNGFAIAANNVTVSGLDIAGPATLSYDKYAWGNRVTRGIVVQTGVTGFNIAGNTIHDIRTGILIDGRDNTGVVSANTIENTKSGISVQYTDGSGIAISNNGQGSNGNEWGVNLHLNGFLDGGVIHQPNPYVPGAPSATWQQALLDLSTTNGGWSVQDQGYASSNRTHVNVKPGGSNLNQGSLLTPLATIQAGINAVVAGGTVNVGEGTFAENVSIGKLLTLKGRGAGSSIIDPVSGDALAISGNLGSGTLLIDGFTFSGAPRYGVKVAGDAVPGSTILGELIVRNSDFIRNGQNGLAVLGDTAAGVPGVGKVTLENDNFVGNGTTTASSLGYGDILFNFYNGDVTFKNLRITGEGEFIGIQMRGRSPNPNQPVPSGTVQFDTVTIDGSFLRPDVPNSNPTWHNVGTWNPGGPGDAIHLLEYSSVDNVSFTNVSINLAAGHGMFLEGLGSTLDIGNTSFGLNTNLTELGARPDDSAAQRKLRVSRNIFVGSNDNGLVTKVDASGATFTGAADGFAIEDRVYHALDFSGLGLVTWDPGHLYVTADSGSIQRGINAACECDMVHVGAGTFAEQLTIDKSLTLVGAGADQTIVAPASLAADADGMKNILTIGGSSTSAEVSGFTFKGPVAGITAGIFVGDGAYASIHNNKVVDIREATAISGNQTGIGIFVGRAKFDTSGTADIVDNEITGYQKGGIVVDGPGSHATITGNTVIGEGATSAIAQNGIQVSRGASATLSGNTVRGNVYTGPQADADDFAAGILFFNSDPYVGQGGVGIAADNTITANQFGIWTNDPVVLPTISLAGTGGNTRNAVAFFNGGYANQGPLLEYPAWEKSNAALVDVTNFGGKQSGDIADVGGSLKVTGWNAFDAIQPAVGAVADGARIDVAAGTYGENVVLGGLRNLYFSDVTLGSLTLQSGGAGSGIGGRVTANGSGGFLFNAAVSLLGDTSLSTTGANIVFNGDIQGAGGNAYAVSLNAGTGSVSLISGGSEGSPLGRLEVQSNNFMLASTLWVTGYDIDALGIVALSNHTLRSVGGGGTDAISAGGDVTGSTISASGVQIQSGGDVAANVTSQGGVAVAASNVSGSFSAPSLSFQAQQSVNVTVNAPGPVEIHSGGPANVSGSAPTLVIDAPSGSASGSFGQVTNAGGGLIDVNGKPQPNVSIAENNANNNRVVPADITTGADDRGEDPRRDKLRRRRPLKDAADVLQNGEALEIDLAPSND